MSNITLRKIDEKTYNIWHLMIDESMQGKGYGFCGDRQNR